VLNAAGLGTALFGRQYPAIRAKPSNGFIGPPRIGFQFLNKHLETFSFQTVPIRASQNSNEEKD
jgi:hypothetical protein